MIAARRRDIIAQVGSRWPRHTLIWPLASEHARIMAEARDEPRRAALDLWRAHDWPLVVRRNDDIGMVSLDRVAAGLPLPPSHGKSRLALHLRCSGIARCEAPLALGAVARTLPPPWQRPLAALDDATRKAHVHLSVFGSAAWQAITGLDYLHDDSDLDLLFRPANVDEIDRVVSLYERWERETHRRIDGEILFSGGDAVAWREWAHAERGARVLAKNIDRVALVKRSTLRARLARPMVPA
jgi:phosphoribosyl-dephospho-CoA transferase